MSSPLVSIVICCHNRREYLGLTLDSVFAQNYRPVEVIVMDDGSTDGTDEFMATYGKGVRYYRQHAQGIAAARTAASRLARGEYIAYQDDDDIMPPDRIVTLLHALQAFPQASFATGDFALIDAQGTLTGHRWMPGPLDLQEPPVLLEDGQNAVLWPRIPAVPHTTLFRRELGERVGWFDLDFKYACSDADFLARLGRLGPVAYVREVVSHYRRGHAALWADNVRTGCSRVQLWEKHLDLIGNDNPALTTRLQERMLGIVVQLHAHLAAGDRDATTFDVESYIARGLAKLSATRRIRYQLQTRLKAPLKRSLRAAGAR